MINKNYTAIHLPSYKCTGVGLTLVLLMINFLSLSHTGLLSCGHRLESILEQAVRQPPGNHCPLLWRLYLALVAATRPKGIKNLAYRALVHCPGIKVSLLYKQVPSPSLTIRNKCHIFFQMLQERSHGEKKNDFQAATVFSNR